MKYNKLVRDKIPEYIRSRGSEPVTHVAGDTEYWQKLKEKLLEEIKEFDESETIEEMADILEVIYAMRDFKKFDKRKLAAIKNRKQKNEAGLKRKLFWKNHDENWFLHRRFLQVRNGPVGARGCH